MGDIRPYDHDAGVSFLVDSATSQAFTELDTRKSGIRIEAGIKELRFNNVSVDLIPWRAENTSNGVTTKVIPHKAYSQVDVLLRETASGGTLPQTAIFPTVVGCATQAS